MDIHTAVALGAVFAGIAIWGPIGALIGIPIAAAIIAVLDTYGERYEIIAEMSDEPQTKDPPDRETATRGRVDDEPDTVPAGRPSDGHSG